MSETATIEAKRGRGRPPKPRAPKRPDLRAPAVLDYLEASRQALAALDLEIAETALAAIEGEPSGKAKLAALHEKIRAVTFEIECGDKARDLALRQDREAAEAWRAAILALPAEQLIEGLTTKTCCKLCEDGFCVISGSGRCLHPRDSNLPATLHSDQRVRTVFRLGADKFMAEKRHNDGNRK